MPTTTVSTSLTAEVAHAYVYPEAVSYEMEENPGDIVYTMELAPRPEPGGSDC